MNKHETPETQFHEQVSHEEISRRAAELWQQSGSPQGRDEEIWLEAERQLRGASFNPNSAPSSETVSPFPASGGGSGSRIGEERLNARETELMEQKRTSSSKLGRNKSRSSGK